MLMAGMKVKFDDAGLNKLLVQNYLGVLKDEADAIGKNVQAAYPGTNVVTSSGVNRKGRPFGIVYIAEVNGIAHQVKHGSLTRAAAQRGIETRRY